MGASGITYNDAVQVSGSNISKPAALHLYPHIHGSKAPVDPVQRGTAHLATGGGLATAQFKSILQPQLYKLHNNPLHQSQLFKQLDKVSSYYLFTVSVNVNECVSSTVNSVFVFSRRYLFDLTSKSARTPKVLLLIKCAATWYAGDFVISFY